MQKHDFNFSMVSSIKSSKKYGHSHTQSLFDERTIRPAFIVSKIKSCAHQKAEVESSTNTAHFKIHLKFFFFFTLLISIGGIQPVVLNIMLLGAA